MSLILSKWILIVASVLLTAVTFQLIRKRKLREEYGLVWLFLGLFMFLLGCFGGEQMPQVLLILGLPLFSFMLLSQSIRLSKSADCIRDLAQHTALLEFRIAELENQKWQPARANGRFKKGVLVTSKGNGSESYAIQE